MSDLFDALAKFDGSRVDVEATGNEPGWCCNAVEIICVDVLCICVDVDGLSATFGFCAAVEGISDSTKLQAICSRSEGKAARLRCLLIGEVDGEALGDAYVIELSSLSATKE